MIMMMTRLLEFDNCGIIRLGVGIEIGCFTDVVQVKMIGNMVARADRRSERGRG